MLLRAQGQEGRETDGKVGGRSGSRGDDVRGGLAGLVMYHEPDT